jgi:hypothetical protein
MLRRTTHVLGWLSGGPGTDTREAIDAWLAARASRKARLGNQEFTITAATA